MPIDRPDGRHWCNPGNETPDKDGFWQCSCYRTWQFIPQLNLWHDTSLGELPKNDPPKAPRKAATKKQGSGS